MIEVSMKVTGDTPDEILSQFESISVALAATMGGEKPTAPKSAGVSGKGAGARKSKTKTDEPQTKAQSPTPREALDKVVSAKGLSTAREILGKFGAARISEVKEKDYAAFIEACEAVK